MQTINPTATVKSIPMPDFRGPQGQKCIVSIGWHVDGESGAIASDPRAVNHLTALSEGAYGVSAALPRILDMHRSLDIPGSFFFPGYVADLHPDAVEAIAAEGHEIAHHGYLHENCFFLDKEAQRDVFLKGIAALERITGKAPVGWSAPTWGVKPDTLELLCELGMIYDCSLMEYDMPYLLSTPAGSLIELPISMVLDDWQIFGASPFPGGGVNATAETAFQIWKEEFDGMRRFGGFFTTTFHPNLMGRPGRLNMLYRLFEYMKSFDDVWWATCEDVAQYSRSQVTANTNIMN
ncbi:polysaccharide deacetylase [Oscillatoria sp. FACHB-1407]|uniref:polysaccharide deacetylase family protein n=1 Tax=Oscillatoria sp. FACHB-1407 TaxID=2692847 RepID=UPI00168282EE|nr:polysaccharide deacetylase [Oscillatoria sp. FACHB-1407]MBD2459726.1 polysaccharide deacetylase [Oscillatoria sp. FACHB-1407]